MTIQAELIQLGIAATPLIVAILLMFWSPAGQVMLKLKGVAGAALLFLPFWLLRSVTGSCTALAHVCAPGEALVRLNPPYWGVGSWDCEQCVGSLSTTFEQLNSWRPTLVILFPLLAVGVSCLVLRQCWRGTTQTSR